MKLVNTSASTSWEQIVSHKATPELELGAVVSRQICWRQYSSARPGYGKVSRIKHGPEAHRRNTREAGLVLSKLRSAQMKASRIALFAAVFVGFFSVVPRALCQTNIPLDPKATYLLTHDDLAAVPALLIPLKSLGISAGDSITIRSQGDFSFCFPTGCPEIQVPACGVFSSNGTLLASDKLQRIGGATPVVDGTVSPCVTVPTLFGQLPTDIPEDFVLDGSSMKVPIGAHYLFVAVADSFYGDNADPGGDLAVVVQRTLVPLSLNVLHRVLVGDGSDRLTTTGPPEVDLFPSEGQLYYVPWASKGRELSHSTASTMDPTTGIQHCLSFLDISLKVLWASRGPPSSSGAQADDRRIRL